MQLRKEAWKKIQDFNEVWTCDLAITGAMLYQLSYEATDVGSRSIVGLYVSVKEMSVKMIYEINHIWTAEMKWKWKVELGSTVLFLRATLHTSPLFYRNARNIYACKHYATVEIHLNRR